jgi:RNase P subunit RPR2
MLESARVFIMDHCLRCDKELFPGAAKIPVKIEADQGERLAYICGDCAQTRTVLWHVY